MTENEAIKKIQYRINTASDVVGKGADAKAFEDLEMAIQALEEIQQYRAMEEKLNGISVEQVVNGFINVTEDRTDEGYERGRILTNAEADMWNEYRAIGTIDEFKDLKEKSVAKKPLNDGMRIPFSYYCPNCKEELSDDGYKPDEEYCVNCGQHILVEN